MDNFDSRQQRVSVQGVRYLDTAEDDAFCCLCLAHSRGLCKIFASDAKSSCLLGQRAVLIPVAC